ncbi:4-hydroxythreonine-4-phosphate dehydrogenase PdxA [Streptomyces sp. ME19-01-6]|uniref:4-hydroxythreonine-4-phosphate dehydrogenase PdxA n=1 Tax=Streptomyces sp. ME19-01-6 TaxID=3028686 RepID=UPI0029B42FAE|nr:4-hydroxythreonine-4-phosphate dehydrogenase PdxA [Streptomyces sp. ME19-01-6]MDX3229008.1 4-hydroxythreonine-4-phosphate dehydrogenase PdxA [Streptomyces sp. ME19-01-6]
MTTSAQASTDPARPRLAVTMGDPAGIGPEITVGALADPRSHDADLVVVGDAARLRQAARLLGLTVPFETVEDPGSPVRQKGAVRVLRTGDPTDHLPFGQVRAEAGRASFGYLETAVRLAMDGRLDGIVTAPVQKEAWHAAGIAHPDHTATLAALTGARRHAMMLANDDLRTVLVTTHLPLSKALTEITTERVLDIIELAHDEMRALGIESPRVAVAGVNPHAGEGGMFGDEETQVIGPAVETARAAGIDASGPHPPDTVFMRARRGEFDIVVAQYHDQGLIPIKLLGVEEGVNVTLGLPFVRTSVDHGTAFDIAGTGRADAGSLRYAIRSALDFVHARRRPSRRSTS